MEYKVLIGTTNDDYLLELIEEELEEAKRKYSRELNSWISQDLILGLAKQNLEYLLRIKEETIQRRKAI